MTLLHVPVIDLSPYLSGSPEGKREVAKQVGQACRDIGFLVISGHGISESLIKKTHSLSSEFFALPHAEKLKVDRPAPDQVRGYSAVGGEGLAFSLDEPTPPDIKESFSIGPVDVPADDSYYTSAEAGPHFAPNVWPARPAELRETWSEYFRAVDGLATSLMRIFALALNLDEHYFDTSIDKNISMMRVLRYPKQTEAPLPGQLRAGAHSDYGSMTILRKEISDRSLQVKNKAGEWVTVPVVEGSFIVNIGDLMQQWTNDLWNSTLHRVVNPDLDSEENRDRLSIVFFHQPNYDAMVECLPGCAAPESSARYEPVSSGDHLKNKFVKQTTFGKGSKAA
ncbi:2OG-Fe(II) oxygenase [Methylorubrum populi BJ001]|jgi:isopenicillin N synthase-like dioxygenase|uniref:2-oxoglutarate-dependent ethylene/succinate-forming enzyme n=1 Tax=Methylorubrum populi (strain ATCC BAA-705 / NCIMB 13946 / BJ001) TaxID=441620 RepID=B1ZES6_METPB|nr:2-oxoglutarate and iron-dependent oxygenase domain-containing protein [Methylorubrum populi]ACB82455.1 2OG-Fe(II) oxygenase [Methylorubrum populi BJ001]OAH30066.1 2OG-Fe(II) oxygenase [Methylorubrum populi]PZP70157.1 MAG: isopenicillin N synthase family oxygenase [Methylorubrum populi]